MDPDTLLPVCSSHLLYVWMLSNHLVGPTKLYTVSKDRLTCLVVHSQAAKLPVRLSSQSAGSSKRHKAEASLGSGYIVL